MPRSSIVSLMGQHSYGDCLIEATENGCIAVYCWSQDAPIIFPSVDTALGWIDDIGWSSSDRWRFFRGWVIKLILEGKFDYWFVWPTAALIVLKANVKRLLGVYSDETSCLV
jgi:hypothetical protein